MFGQQRLFCYYICYINAGNDLFGILFLFHVRLDLDLYHNHFGIRGSFVMTVVTLILRMIDFVTLFATQPLRSLTCIITLQQIRNVLIIKIKHVFPSTKQKVFITLINSHCGCSNLIHFTHRIRRCRRSCLTTLE